MSNKNAFSLLELIFAIVVIGIVSSIAVPRLIDTKANAQAATIKKDVATIISSVRAYFVINENIEDLNSVLTLNQNMWDVDGNSAIYKDEENNCILISIEDKKLHITLFDDNNGKICTKIKDSGISSEVYDL